jgi:hypothetical protein
MLICINSWSRRVMFIKIVTDFVEFVKVELKGGGRNRDGWVG